MASGVMMPEGRVVSTFGIGAKPSCIQCEAYSRLMGGAFEN